MNTPTDPSPAPGRRRAILLLLLVFLLGAACGIGGGLLVLRRAAQRAFAGESGANRSVELLTFAMEKQVFAELDLTPAERAAAERELTVTATQLKDLRTRLRTDMRAVVEDSIMRIEQHLPPDKRSRFRERAAKRLQPWGLAP